MVDRHISAVKAKHGPSLAKTTRSVLSGVCALACRYDALVTNPCREVARISTKPKRPPTALTAEELRRLHQWLSSDEQSIERDLPDLVLFLIATGLRIGEALAVQWAELAWMMPQWRYGGPSYVCAPAGSLSSRPQSPRLDGASSSCRPGR